MMKFSRGDIILCRIPMPSDDFKKLKVRPALIVSKNLNNDRLDDVIVAICTTNISRHKETSQYLIDGDEITRTGIKLSSVVKCETLLTINKSMIIKVLGKLSEKGLYEVNECLKDALDL
ncbi:MAG: mRNA interferase MazF6 [bacterium ADurb.Bin363]|nr:MAG: mRNA interferase MazF6 [bacterium ADurb.Bin363]